MNAIVALCHFCETHGPCILFCTQAFHSAHDAQLLMDSVPPDKRVPYAPRVGGASVSHEPPASVSEAPVSSLIQPPPQSDHCEGCRSVPTDQPGFISYDDQARISYISGQYPEQPQLYSVLRQACVRSLNCEVCPGREGPIVFGEDSGCHVLSHTFNLQDSQARGFRRLYSFIVVMMDRVFLINSWPFLVKHFRKLIDDLQAKADLIFSSESDETKSTTSRSLRSSLSGPDHLRRIRANQTGRSLVDITGDVDIFVYLHKYFVFLLKAGGQRVVECVLEGPPQVMASPQRSLSQSQEEEEDRHERALTTLDFKVVSVDGQPFFQSLKHLFKVLDKHDFVELAYHILKGDQLIVRGSDISTVTSIIAVLKDLVPESCCRIVGFSSAYKEPFVCNFLGLSVGVELPPHVVASELHVLLDILPPLGRHYSRVNEEVSLPLSRQASPEPDPLRYYKLMVYSAAARLTEQKYPVFLQRLVALLSSDMSDKLIDKGVASLKEEWMKKVKVLYKFSQMGHMDHPQSNERLNKLLVEVLLVSTEELPLLQYWRSALNKDYRAHLIKAEKS